MSLGYATAYRFGITPWERAGEASVEHFAALLDREERERPRPLGRALDLGCGNGTHSVQLASRGWQVTGVDFVGRAVRTAQERAQQAGATVRFVEADVTDLQSAGIAGAFTFLLDVGCFHGLADHQRAAMGREVTSVVTADATLLMLAFQPGRRGPLPRGASAEQVETAFPLWHIVDDQLADTTGMPGPLKKAAPHWYRLRRSGS
jgi:SAM-dependent methyltransferase